MFDLLSLCSLGGAIGGAMTASRMANAGALGKATTFAVGLLVGIPCVVFVWAVIPRAVPKRWRSASLALYLIDAFAVGWIVVAMLVGRAVGIRVIDGLHLSARAAAAQSDTSTVPK
jgi:hypothetical protein